MCKLDRFDSPKFDSSKFDSPEKKLRQWFRRMGRWFWVVTALAGFWTALALGAQGIEPINLTRPSRAAVVSQGLSTQVPEVSWQHNVTAGVEAFDQGRLLEAIAHWQTALSTIDRLGSEPVNSVPDSRLTKAYLLSNIAAAHMQLGQLTTAQSNIAESLDIVNSWPTQSQSYWEISARVLNTQGRILYQLGQT